MSVQGQSNDNFSDMESSNDQTEDINSTDINYVPEEVLELIFIHLSQYADLKSVMLVSKQWHRIVCGKIFCELTL